MELKVDAIVSPVLFEEEDQYPFVRPSSTATDLMDRLGRASAQWENMDFDERIQAYPTYIHRV